MKTRSTAMTIALDEGSPAFVAVTPEEKAAIVRRATKEGEHVGPFVRRVAVAAARAIVPAGLSDRDTVYNAAHKCGIPAGRFIREVMAAALEMSPHLDKARAAAVKAIA